MSKTSKFIVLSTLRHSGEALEVGDSVSLTEKEAAPLLKSATIGRPSDPQTQAMTAEVKAKLAEEEKTRKAEEKARQEQQAAEQKRQKEETEAQAKRLEAEAEALRNGSSPVAQSAGQVGSTAGVGGVNALNEGSANGTGNGDPADTAPAGSTSE